MIDPTTETMVRGLMVEGYMDAILVAERRGTSVEDIKLLCRQILLGLFLSANEIGIDHHPADVRRRELENQLRQFMDNGLAMYENQLFEEANATKSNSALRLMGDKELTTENPHGGISSQLKGESNE